MCNSTMHDPIELDKLANNKFALNIEYGKHQSRWLSNIKQKDNFSNENCDNIFYCMSVIELAEKKNGKQFITKGNRCKDNLCFNCQRAEYVKNANNAKNAIRKTKNRYPDAEFIFLTFTDKNAYNDIDLDKSINKMNKSISNIQRRKKFDKSYLGIIKAREITVNNNKYLSYNQHFHCLVAVKPSFFNKDNYISEKEFQKWFKKNMKTKYKPLVDMQRVKPEYNHKGETLIQSAEHVAEYIAKPFDVFSYVFEKIDNKDNEKNEHRSKYKKVMSTYREKKVVRDLENALMNKRLITYGGYFRIAMQHVRLDKQILNKHNKAKNERDIVKKYECEYIATKGKYYVTNIIVPKRIKQYPNSKMIFTDKIRASKKAVTASDILLKMNSNKRM